MTFLLNITCLFIFVIIVFMCACVCVFIFWTGDDHQLPVPSPTTINNWREAVVMYNHNKYMELLGASVFVLLGDGSHRSGEHEFPLLANFYHYDTQKHIYKLIGIIDLATDGTANNMSQHIHDLLAKYNIPPTCILAMVTDNTNSMSGQHGGAVALLSQLLQHPIVRIPCAMHVLHLCINNNKEQVYLLNHYTLSLYHMYIYIYIIFVFFVCVYTLDTGVFNCH
jgi:hypothetical protein